MASDFLECLKCEVAFVFGHFLACPTFNASASMTGLRYLAMNSSSLVVGVTAAIAEASVTTAVKMLMIVQRSIITKALH